jgi:hypothetical protein
MSAAERPSSTEGGDQAAAGSEERVDVEGPDVDELDDDPAYDPDDPGLKDVKGG